MSIEPWIRIVLRYVFGAGLLGSQEVGDMLAADPDVVNVIADTVFIVSATGVPMVEAWYQWAKGKGKET